MRELESHCQCDNCSGDDCRDLPKPKTISELTTSELVAELCKRKGVRMLTSTEYHWYKVFIEHEDDYHSISDAGAARILVVKE